VNVSLFPSLFGYRATWLSRDLLAGVMLAAIALPEQLATARLAGFPVESGLFAFAAGTLALVLFDNNRFLSVGADSTVAPIFAASLGALAVSGGGTYLQLAGLLAVCVGALLIGAGIARASWLADLLSVPVTTGFLAGISVHVVIGQLPALLGVREPGGPLLVALATIVPGVAGANPYTLALGLGVLGITLLSARVSARIPGALVGTILAALAVRAFDLRRHGVDVIGPLAARFPAPRLTPLPDFRLWAALAPLAIVVAVVCALQTAVVVRAFPVDPDAGDDVTDDFIAVGIGNVVAGLSGSFVVNASPPRTAVLAAARARSQAGGFIAVALLALLLAFFARATTDLPQAALAGVLIFVALRLFRWRTMRDIARKSRREIQLVIAGALLVIVLPIQTGMLLAIVLSLAHGVSLVMRPPATQLFRVRDSTVWWPPTGEHQLVDDPGIVVFAPAAPVNFTNAQYIRDRLFALVTRARSPVRLLIIEASGMSDVDYTGSQMLQRAIGELRARGTDVALARLIGPHAQSAAQRSGLIDALGGDHVFLSVQAAIVALTTPVSP
jgi:MFS superfamily sulfate permease-like transporter